MTFHIVGLPLDDFLPLFALGEAALAACGMKRYQADAKPGFPCRVTLADAEPGETVLLLSFRHQPACSPYRASGPIFVRQAAKATALFSDAVPESLRTRLLSLRAYDDAGFIRDAEVTEGRDLETQVERFFADPAVAYLHAHYARRGCYAARIDRG